MKAKSIKGKSLEEIQSALQQSMADDFKPTLAIVFLSVSQDRQGVCKILDDAGIKIFGATTNGEFIDENLINYLLPFFCLISILLISQCCFQNTRKKLS